jgi:outer membrane protein OmpA-like peptidoglycan-associated protein
MRFRLRHRAPAAPGLALLGILALARGAGAATQHFGANLSQSRWQFIRSDSECVLTHQIPRYGRAMFWQTREHPLRFALYVEQPPISDGYATLRSVPPEWMHGAGTRELGKITIQGGSSPVVWGRERALRLYYELENGRFPHFRYRDWADGQDEVDVTLSAVRFRDVAPAFRICTASLQDPTQGQTLPVVMLEGDDPHGALAQQTVIHFATDSDQLSPAARRSLTRLGASLLGDRRSRGLSLEGHADRRGTDRYNDALSQRRARVVKDYLSSVLGIPAQRIRMRHFGEHRPLDPADNESAWARNRRVSIAWELPDPTAGPITQARRPGDH